MKKPPSPKAKASRSPKASPKPQAPSVRSKSKSKQKSKNSGSARVPLAALSKKAATPIRKIKKTPGRPPGVDTAWHADFLYHLAAVPFVTHAAQKAGTTPQTAYDHRSRFPDFKDKWDAALKIGNAHIGDTLEYTAYERAVIGITVDILDKYGDKIGEERKFDNNLLTILLKAKRPEQYRDKIEHTGEVKFIPLDELADRVG